MAVPTTTAPIAQALVQKLRANTALKAGLKGGFHEGPAPNGTKEPYLMYGLHYGPVGYVWGSAMLTPGFHIYVVSHDQVEARNLDALVVQTLHDVDLDISGQSTLFARRTLQADSNDTDDEGHKVYLAGGIHEFWSDQDL